MKRSKPIKILKASQKDISDIVLLNSFVQKIHAEKHPDIFKPVENDGDLKQFFEYILSNDKNYILLAYIDSDPVGYIWISFELRPDNPFTFERKQVYIHHIVVHEEFRGQHIGNALFSEINNIARQKDIYNFALDTWAFNENAQRFFEKLGFITYNIRMWRNDESRT